MVTDIEKKKAEGKPFDVVALVADKLRGYTVSKELVLPANYSIENALKFAWLALQESTDKERRPVLEVCTQNSIANALLNMAVQGLNPGKAQCYFIAYGTKLMCQRSYFGTMAVAQRVAGASDIWAEVVYEGDDFEYTISRNRKNVSKHTQKLDNIKPGAIVAAYCVIEFSNEKPTFTEIMTIEQIKKAWNKSKAHPESPESVHSQFPEEMAKRTVTNRACKALINSSSDNNLLLEHFNRTDEERSADELALEMGEKADKDLLELDGTEVIEGQGMVEGPEEKEPEDTVVTEIPEIKRDPKSLQTVAAMIKACSDDFSLTKEQVLAELGVTTTAAIVESPAACYSRIAVVRAGPQEPKGKPDF